MQFHYRISKTGTEALAHEKEVGEVLADYGVEVVTYLVHAPIDSVFCSTLGGKNSEYPPSLLPDFQGTGTQRRDCSRCGKSGCTVHFVDSGMDTGPIIDQFKVEVSR